MSKHDTFVDKLAKKFANRIGSPYGEGATYERELTENLNPIETKENGRADSHLDDNDFELFVKDLKQTLLAKLDEVERG